MAKNKQTLATLTELANLHESPKSVEKFSREHYGYTGALSIKGASILLRDIWRGGKKANRIATMILSGQAASRTISASMQEAIKSGAEPPLSEDALLFLSPISADWPHQELVYKGQSGLQQDLYTLLKCSRMAKICARPDCPYTPYFVANDTRTRYCSTDCADAMQDKWRNDWWKTHGKAWRKKRNRGKGK